MCSHLKKIGSMHRAVKMIPKITNQISTNQKSSHQRISTNHHIKYQQITNHHIELSLAAAAACLCRIWQRENAYGRPLLLPPHAFARSGGGRAPSGGRRSSRRKQPHAAPPAAASSCCQERTKRIEVEEKRKREEEDKNSGWLQIRTIRPSDFIRSTKRSPPLSAHGSVFKRCWFFKNLHLYFIIDVGSLKNRYL